MGEMTALRGVDGCWNGNVCLGKSCRSDGLVVKGVVGC